MISSEATIARLTCQQKVDTFYTGEALQKGSEKLAKRSEDQDWSKGRAWGYARVSTEDQNENMQVRALEKVGCHQILVEKVSGASKKRPKLDLAIKNLRRGDTLYVWRLDRLARTVRQFHQRVDEIHGKGARLVSLTERFETEKASGAFMMNLLAAVAELERQLTIERTEAGIEAAKERGVKFGRASIMTEEKIALAQKLRDEGKSVRQISELMGLSKGTVTNYTVGPQGGRGKMLKQEQD